MNLGELLIAGLVVGLILGLTGGVAHIVWQRTHPHGYWTYGTLGRRWHNPRETRYW